MTDAEHSPMAHGHHAQDASHHEHDHAHDWDSAAYVAEWAVNQDRREADRQVAFGVLVDAIPYAQDEPIRILDIGAGYGALTRVLLERFPNATAACQDGSPEMAALGRQRLARFEGRFEYFISDFSRPGWGTVLAGPFDVAVSSLAIHNVGSPAIIRAIYREAFSLIAPAGQFLSFDLQTPPVADQLEWLREAGFVDVRCLWQDDSRAVLRGVRESSPR